MFRLDLYLNCFYLCDQCDAFWVEICPALRTQWTTPLNYQVFNIRSVTWDEFSYLQLLMYCYSGSNPTCRQRNPWERPQSLTSYLPTIGGNTLRLNNPPCPTTTPSSVHHSFHEWIAWLLTYYKVTLMNITAKSDFNY